MGFEIAIYNGISDDGRKIINSIKAAFLYADSVRVYDLINHDADYEGIEALISARERIRGKWYEECGRIMKRYPFLEDDSLSDDEILTCLSRIPADEKLLILEAVNGNNERKGLEILKTYTTLSVCTQVLREHDNALCVRDNYQNLVSRLGVEVIEPSINTGATLPAVEDWLIGFREQFLDDKGFILSNESSEESKLDNSSIFVPASLSEYAISTLPGFDEATLDEIIDIRQELNKYIIPYRAAILRMSQAIKEIPNTASFKRECMTLYNREIEPQIATINEAIHDNNIFKNIAKKVVTNKETWVSAGALVTAFATTGNIANAVSIGAATALAGLSITEGIVSTLEEKKKVKDNEMFFLYEAGQRLRK